MSDPIPARQAGEEKLVKLYLELTGASELCARSVVHYLEVSVIPAELSNKHKTVDSGPDE